MGTAIVTWIVEPRAVQETPEAVGRMLAQMMAQAADGALGVVIVGGRDEARRFADEILRRADEPKAP